MKTKANECDLKVWWIPQVPMKPFEVPVRTLREGRLLLDTLAQYDIFQFNHNIKPNYCNAGGLSIFEDGEWSDWSSGGGEAIDDLTESQIEEIDARKAIR